MFNNTMLRQTHVIGPHTYLIDVYDAQTDLRNETHYSQFVMLRNFTLINEVTTDKDIYLIDKEIYDEIVNELIQRNNDDDKDVVTSKTVFPIPNINLKNFSAKANSFNENITRNSLYIQHKNDDGYDFGYDVYPLYGDDDKLAEIACNKCRIYHPSNFSTNNLIIYIDNYINNIHFHYFCKKISDFAQRSETIFTYNNREYFEFVEFYFPNIHELFGDNKHVYYNEDLDIVMSQNKDDDNDEDEIGISRYSTTSNKQRVPLKLLIQPFKIVNENGTNAKQYLDIIKSIENNYLTYPFNLTLFSFSELDDTTKNYYIDTELQSSTNTFLSDCKFSIKAKLGFSNGKLAVMSMFEYPNQEEFEVRENISKIRQAYEYYNCVNQEMYDNYFTEYDKILYDDINKLTYKDLTQKDKDMVKLYYNQYNLNNTELLNLYKQMRINAIKEELREDLGTDDKFLGFIVQISSTMDFIKPLYEKQITIKFNELDDIFAFELNGIFETWNELPTHLLARIIFVDRFLGTMLHSNYVIITKEWFKYMINDIDIYSLSQLQDLNNKYTISKKQNNGSMKAFTLSEDNINFLNNITCIVQNTNDNDTNNTTTSVSQKPKVLYKPIFYRVNDLQTIRLRRNVQQNIGVNLADYMTKVDTFKLVLDNGTELVETARNDIYVIFRINAGALYDNGTYDVIDQDGEYISSGNYILY